MLKCPFSVNISSSPICLRLSGVYLQVKERKVCRSTLRSSPSNSTSPGLCFSPSTRLRFSSFSSPALLSFYSSALLSFSPSLLLLVDALTDIQTSRLMTATTDD